MSQKYEISTTYLKNVFFLAHTILQKNFQGKVEKSVPIWKGYALK